MPTYLIHGFKWTRKAIRIHIILNDIEDAAPDWIISKPTSIALQNSFYTAFDFLPCVENTPSPSPSQSPRSPKFRTRREPNQDDDNDETFNSWSLVKFLEQYSTDDNSIAQPYAFVGDYVTTINHSISVSREIEAYEQRKAEEILSLSVAASGLNTPTTHSPTKIPFAVPETKPENKESETADEITALEPTVSGIRKMSSRDFRRRKKRIGWLEKLRDQLEKEAEIGWFVVVCEDEERGFGDGEEVDGDRGGGGDEVLEPRGLRKFFRRTRSELSLRGCGMRSSSK